MYGRLQFKLYKGEKFWREFSCIFNFLLLTFTFNKVNWDSIKTKSHEIQFEASKKLLPPDGLPGDEFNFAHIISKKSIKDHLSDFLLKKVSR